MPDTESKPVAPPDSPENEPSALELAMAPLTEQERTFVYGVLEGEDHASAALRAGWRRPLAYLDLLGRPRVASALETLAPLLADDAKALAALRPLLRMRLYRATAGRQALGAIRDFLALVAPNAQQDESVQRWAQAQQRRAEARGKPSA